MQKVKARNDRIDQLLQQRQDSLLVYSQSVHELVEMGVKIGSMQDGSIEVPQSFTPYMEKYNRSNLEFEWQVQYEDGTVLDQFGLDTEHHFGHIDQSRIKRVSWISNFIWPTDNVDRRVIVSLDWQSGLFSFLNGFCPQEVLAKVAVDPIQDPKELILFMKRRSSSQQGDVPEHLKPYHPPVDSIFYYNQFILGFKTQAGAKRQVIIMPNGVIDTFEN